MDKELWWKIGGSAIVFLLGLALWFAQAKLSDVQTEFAEVKAQNKAQWQAQQKLSERLARIEGFHEAERCYQNKETGK